MTARATGVTSGAQSESDHGRRDVLRRHRGTQSQPSAKPVKMYDEREGCSSSPLPAGRGGASGTASATRKSRCRLASIPMCASRKRERHDEARKLIAKGVEPWGGTERRQTAVAARTENGFEAVRRKRLADREDTVEPSQHVKTRARMENDVSPGWGRRRLPRLPAAYRPTRHQSRGVLFRRGGLSPPPPFGETRKDRRTATA